MSFVVYLIHNFWNNDLLDSTIQNRNSDDLFRLTANSQLSSRPLEISECHNIVSEFQRIAAACAIKRISQL